jgi:hypothetical protein
VSEYRRGWAHPFGAAGPSEAGVLLTRRHSRRSERGTAHLIAFAVFNVTGTGHDNPKYQGALEPLDANAVAVGGGVAGQACTVGTQVCVINLVA